MRACDDVPGLTRLAVEHKVAPWLSSVIASNRELAAAPRFEAIRQAGTAQMMQSLGLFAELSQLVRLLNARDIQLVVLKGPVIAEEYYPDAALRPYGDLDLLIREGDLLAVSEMLVARGYREKNGDDHEEGHRLHACHGIFQRIFIHPESGAVVELHCDHLQIGLEPVSMDDIWSGSTEVRIGAGVARALEPHDLFVQLCIHLQRHGFSRLIWFKDLDLMIRRGVLDWRTVEERARQQGCRDSVAYTLWLVERMLGTPLPAPAQILVRRQPWVSKTVDHVLWPPKNVLGLVPQRQWRLRRLVQFAPESGILRGGLPSLLTTGRRADKLRVMGAAVQGRGRG
ncbi:MAG TPA: nucleotidyltransferase family protein [Tepidiformaceae bacterium]|nr:nucleotidyltransferase family protein [Tepidiformaceae bacterium]